jgi:hypothetical protein
LSWSIAPPTGSHGSTDEKNRFIDHLAEGNDAGASSAWRFGPDRFISVPTGTGGCSPAIPIPVGCSSDMRPVDRGQPMASGQRHHPSACVSPASIRAARIWRPETMLLIARLYKTILETPPPVTSLRPLPECRLRQLARGPNQSSGQVRVLLDKRVGDEVTFAFTTGRVRSA